MRQQNKNFARVATTTSLLSIAGYQMSTGQRYSLKAGGCNVDNRCIGYYDFGQVNRDSSAHLMAMQSYMELLAVNDASSDSRPWHFVSEGTASIEWQNNNYDCGPSFCLMADSLVLGVPLSVVSCNAVKIVVCTLHRIYD